MTQTQQQITNAYQHGKITFKLWDWCTRKLEQLERKYDSFMYDEVYNKFTEELENARKSRTK